MESNRDMGHPIHGGRFQVRLLRRLSPLEISEGLKGGCTIWEVLWKGIRITFFDILGIGYVISTCEGKCNCKFDNSGTPQQ